MSLAKNLLSDLADHHLSHARSTDWYVTTASKLDKQIAEIHGPHHPDTMNLSEIGELHFPYFSMGNIDSLKLFGMDELIIFSFYFANRKRYSNVLDLGANIGLHTLVMSKLGFNVTSYEPDLTHLNQIHKVLTLNNINPKNVIPKAISDRAGSMEYIRVLGNTTGSHLLGAKDTVYGPTDVVSVEVDDILEVLNHGSFDFVKMDVEGHEAVLLNRITPESLEKTDIVLEIGSEKNASEIFEIITKKGILAYAQKMNWGPVQKREDLPSHYTQGSVFLSMQGAPNWNCS
jgi:FkbM family methyltransferase